MIKNSKFEALFPAVAQKITPMVEDMIREYPSNIHSIHVVGSAVISDYDEKRSDINSVIVLNSMDLKFIEFLAPLGKKYGKKGIAAPLIMTPEYIQNSLDAFPIEFHDFKLIHRTIMGQDILIDLVIDKPHLRLQCEREIKTKQIGLRQGYLSSVGRKGEIGDALLRSFTGSMALFRAILHLLGKEPPVARTEVVSLFGAATGIDTAAFEMMLAMKSGVVKPSQEELLQLFESYYSSLEATGKIVDELSS